MIEKFELGVCVVPILPHGWNPRVPTESDWGVLADCGVTLVRMQADPTIGCPTPDETKWWGGLDPRGEFDAAQWDKHWNEPALLRRYAEPTSLPGLRLQLNMANKRPEWAKDDPNFFYRAARTLAGYSRFWDCKIDSFSFGNEPGYTFTGEGVTALEAANRLNDYFADLFSFSEGIRSALPFDAVLSGPDADSDDALDQITGLEESRYWTRPQFSCLDRISIHPYGDVRENMAYATTEKFLHTAAVGHRPIDITEIGGQGGEDVGDETSRMLFDWYVTTTTKYPAIKRHYLLDPRYLTENHTWVYSGQPDPKASELGRQFAAHVAKLNGVVVAPAPPAPAPEPPPPPEKPPLPQPPPADPTPTLYATELPTMPDTSNLNPSWDYVVRLTNGHFAIGMKGANAPGFPPAGAVRVWPQP